MSKGLETELREVAPGRKPKRSFVVSALMYSLLLLAGFCFYKAMPSPAIPTEGAPALAADAPAGQRQLLTRPIAEIQLGHRVLADNPLEEDLQEGFETVEPATWRKLTLRMTKVDGSLLDIQLLRPVEWIDAYCAVPGITIELDLAELGAEGPAEVLAIDPCPEIEPGERPLVTGTFEHTAANVVDLKVESEVEPIGTTDNHPFWSEDRQEFVEAGELRIGETLRLADGQTTRVTSIVPRAGPQTVYNLEISGEHVYHVGDSGVLVHNTYGGRKTLEEIVQHYGGTKLVHDPNPNAYFFPSKHAAKQAASEIAGNLGKNPVRVPQSSYREPTLTWSAASSKRVIGKHSQTLDEFGNPVAGHHDHFAGHSAFGESRGHINAWGRFGDY